jgi:hypothetical protein
MSGNLPGDDDGKPYKGHSPYLNGIGGHSGNPSLHLCAQQAILEVLQRMMK